MQVQELLEYVKPRLEHLRRRANLCAVDDT